MGSLEHLLLKPLMLGHPPDSTEVGVNCPLALCRKRIRPLLNKINRSKPAIDYVLLSSPCQRASQGVNYSYPGTLKHEKK